MAADAGLSGGDESRTRRLLAQLMESLRPHAESALRALLEEEERQRRPGGVPGGKTISPEVPELYRLVFEHVPAGVVVITREGSVLQANPVAARILGLTLDELTQRWVSDFDLETIHEDGSPCPMEDYPVSRCLLTGEPQPPSVLGVRTPQGEVHWAEFTAVPLFEPGGGRQLGAVVTFLDVTRYKVAEQARQRAERRFAVLADSAPEYVFGLTREGRIVGINRLVEGYSREDIEGTVWTELMPLELRAGAEAVLEEVFRSGSVQPFEGVSTNGRTFRNQLFPVFDGAGAISQVMVVSSDVTEEVRALEQRRQLEQRIQRAQGHESLVVLAGGIAHDFNNLLVGIQGNLDLALRLLPSSEGARGHLEDALAASKAAADLTRQLMAYAGNEQTPRERHDLNAVLGELSSLLTASISRKVRLDYALSDGLPEVVVNGVQLRQVVLNVVRNAAESYGDRPGCVVVRTGWTEGEDVGRRASGPGHFGAKRYVTLSVEDEGCGMEHSVRTRMFDPFFSTKRVGRGLGLAAVHGILRAHGGGVAVESEPGRGTRVEVFWPEVVGEGGGGSGGVEPEREVEEEGATVLVVDDEHAVRAVARSLLEEQGLRVLTVATGGEAVEAFAAEPERIRVVILDLLLPDVDGEEVFRRLRAIRADVPVILSSGYGREALSRFAEGELAGFLPKPYALDDLLDSVLGSLAAPPRARASEQAE